MQVRPSEEEQRMASLITPDRCLPPDLINPFVDWRVAPLACALLLISTAAVLHILFPAGTGRPSRLALVVSVAGLCALAVSAWVWLQSALFIVWCVPFVAHSTWLWQVQVFDERAIPVAVQITEGVTAAVLAVSIAALCYRLIARARAAHA
jgi:hypothetical protein